MSNFAPTAPITFAPSHRPVLSSGDYTIAVAQTVNPDLDPQPFTATRQFSVSGERFALDPASIRSVFPPAGSLGDHSAALPHVVLDRSTLPFERGPGGTGANQPPWLALLVFEEDERPQPQALTLGELSGTVPAAAAALERHQSPGDPVTVIDVPPALLANLLPAYSDLGLLVHVRTGGAEDVGESAVVVAHRLPAPGVSCTAHLVSVEGRYHQVAGSGWVLNNSPTAPGGLIRLVSLTSWRFACVDGQQSFAALTARLGTTNRAFRLPNSASAPANRYLAQGFVPVRHQLRDGGRSIGWYRGPLTPGPVADAAVGPARTADALLRYDGELGMFDVSYAAAWQLGRLLALRSPDVAGSFYAWHRRRAQRAARSIGSAYPLAVADLDIELPAAALGWLSDLARLVGVPLRYLVPDERLLPAESIQFVGVDSQWVRRLLDGACGIGRLSAADAARDAEQPPPYDLPSVVTGALIRSEVLAGHPKLLVDGYADAAATSQLTLLRMDRFGPDLALCLFDGTLVRLDLHQSPEAQHLAVAVAADGVRAPVRGASPVGPLALGQHRTLPLGQLVTAMAQAIGLPPAEFTSARLAYHLTAVAERVAFTSRQPSPDTMPLSVF